MYSEDWQALGDVQFRKWDCYESLGWDISVDDHQVVGAPYGGPLAVLRDERKMVSYPETPPYDMMVYLSSLLRDHSAERHKEQGGTNPQFSRSCTCSA